MPQIQKLHEKYQDKGVAVFGVSSWEQNDPVAVMTKKNYTFGLGIECTPKNQRVRCSPILSKIVISEVGTEVAPFWLRGLDRIYSKRVRRVLGLIGLTFR